MKILRLTYNEILKQVKKRGFKICLTILLLFAILMPILYKAFVYDDDDFLPLYFKEDVDYYQDQLVDNAKSDQDKLFNELINVKVDVIKTALEKNENSSQFKINLYQEYINAKMMPIILDSMINKENINYEEIDSWFEIDSNQYTNLNKLELEDVKHNFTNTIGEFEKIVSTGDYTWYIKLQKGYLSEVDNKNEKRLNELYDKLIELDVKDENDFRAKEANNIIDYYNQKEVLMSEKDYKSLDKNLSYEKYVKLTNMKNDELDKNIEKSFYAINNNINYNNDTKVVFNDAVETNITILSVIIVIIAGGIVSNEFQKGTIRLLVIRPNKRWKILLSKFLAVVVLSVGFGLVTYIASFIASGIAFGFSNYFISDLSVVSGEVIKNSYIINSIGNTLLQLIPIIFVGLGAFFLSTVTNNTAFSVGFSIFVLMGSELAIMVLSLIGFPFIDFTFLPYMDFGQFTNKLELASNCDMFGIYYTLTKALGILSLWSIVIYLISNTVFNRKDIKN